LPSEGTTTALELKRSWWILLTLVPLGLMGWGALVYAGVRARRRTWTAAGIVYLAAVIAAFVLVSAEPDAKDTWYGDLGGALILFAWAVPFVHALVIRRPFLDCMEVLESGELDQAEDTLRLRAEARRIANEDPHRARELGIGRPELEGAFDGGLVDLNHASAGALALLPGIGEKLARRVVEVREEIDGFSSLEDLGLVLSLPAATIDRIRERAVVLPRASDR
jgi:4-amino-4-deoxy-L-arabinose transferase-like glycosyltransferase